MTVRYRWTEPFACEDHIESNFNATTDSNLSNSDIQLDEDNIDSTLQKLGNR